MSCDTLTCSRLDAPKSAIFTFPLESLKILAPVVMNNALCIIYAQ